MKKSKIIASLVLSISGSAYGAAYSTDFSSMGAFGSDVNGVDGWTISDTTDQYSFVANWNSSKAIGLGDASAVTTVPPVNTVTLSHAFGNDFGTSAVNFDFALIDSFVDSGKLNRDTFGISLISAGSDILSILLTPDVPTPTNPDDNSENSGNGAKWNVDYAVNGGPTIPLNMALFEGATYAFSLVLSPNVNPSLTDFQLSITGSNVLMDGAAGLAIDPNSVSDEFGLFWSKTGTNDFGSNLILMDNLQLVPEPSSGLLFVISGLALAFRRRR